MSFSYEVRRNIQLLLFVIQSLGGRTTPNMAFIVFYLADLRFLGMHGRLTFGNFYMAMKNGPIPFNILSLLMELNNQGEGSIAMKLKNSFFVDEDGGLRNKVKYDPDYLSNEEVESLFLTIQAYKKIDVETLRAKTIGLAWQQADTNSIISVLKMAEEINVDSALIQSIASLYDNEKTKTIVNEEKIKAAKIFTGE
ncbi:hypothetical protein CJD36_011135 [Flavipsychrobacter stenotrophus]|uniref:Antitoxin SocA-like Panacea domain-containing protein n=1 Tax=Flavipsychrobacter stenotrophus TaxID=2077091 RepID=A0A2S7SUC1_9BACT|nr:type II toxin-antitoxin system antitoxin SocA domain-containing protein [Flavipsychrobacter stenotrophus]PQJ10522.1 hypothetical protein CJD36_011135 [Flavipsychrobacter stenotrophus]